MSRSYPSSGPCSYYELDGLRPLGELRVVFHGLEIEIDGFLDVLERVVPVAAFADAAGQAGHNDGKAAFFAGLEQDSECHGKRVWRRVRVFKAGQANAAQA